MKAPFITDILKQVYHSRLRRIMRGYRFLKKSNQLGLIASIHNELAKTKFDSANGHGLKFIFGAGVVHSELIIRQYLLMRIGWLNLNRVLLYALGRDGSVVIYPMPRLWQQVISKHGFKVAGMRCSLAWVMCVGLFWCYGVLSIAKQIYISILEIIRPQPAPLGRYVYFVRLVNGNLPQPCRDGHSHDIITWYNRWGGKAKCIDAYCHSVANARVCNLDGCPVVFNKYTLPPLISLPGLVRFITWSIIASLCSFLDLLRGHWWNALFLHESVDAVIVRFQAHERLACDYMFHNSGWLYRPLWTYEAEKKGSRIIFYFYSTNCERFKLPDGYPEQMDSYQAMNWPFYLVWDKYQADFVRRAVGEDANIEIVGPIWFYNTSVEMPDLPASSVAVFDIQPRRKYQYRILCAAQEYYVPQTVNQFLLDVYSVVRECKGVMVHKRKRNIGKMLHPQYASLIKNFEDVGDMFSIEPDISAVRVIERSFAVISMPFTSTALLGRELGRPSIYYDPCGVVQKDDRAAHGIQVLTGKEELRNWLTNLYKNPC